MGGGEVGVRVRLTIMLDTFGEGAGEEAAQRRNVSLCGQVAIEKIQVLYDTDETSQSQYLAYLSHQINGDQIRHR